MGKKVLLTGATGMIGSLILEHCLASPEVSSVVSLVRRPTGLKHEILEEVIVEDFSNLTENSDCYSEVEIVYYCLGVYTGAVSREEFYKITVEYPETLAKVLAQKSPGLRFCLLSGAGADRKEKSRMMFAKDKGIIENRLSAIGFRAFHAFRPGYIYPVTPRHEPNFSYKLMRSLYPLLKVFGKGASIKSTELAETMFRLGLNGCDQEILENREILQELEQQQKS